MSLVEELQSDALKETVPVCELLNKSLIVATKLNQVEFGEWIRLELDGYTHFPLKSTIKAVNDQLQATTYSVVARRLFEQGIND